MPQTFMIRNRNETIAHTDRFQVVAEPGIILDIRVDGDKILVVAMEGTMIIGSDLRKPFVEIVSKKRD